MIAPSICQAVRSNPESLATTICHDLAQRMRSLSSRAPPNFHVGHHLTRESALNDALAMEAGVRRCNPMGVLTQRQESVLVRCFRFEKPSSRRFRR